MSSKIRFIKEDIREEFGIGSIEVYPVIDLALLIFLIKADLMIKRDVLLNCIGFH